MMFLYLGGGGEEKDDEGGWMKDQGVETRRKMKVVVDVDVLCLVMMIMSVEMIVFCCWG